MLLIGGNPVRGDRPLTGIPGSVLETRCLKMGAALELSHHFGGIKEMAEPTMKIKSRLFISFISAALSVPFLTACARTADQAAPINANSTNHTDEQPPPVIQPPELCSTSKETVRLKCGRPSSPFNISYEPVQKTSDVPKFIFEETPLYHAVMCRGAISIDKWINI